MRRIEAWEPDSKLTRCIIYIMRRTQLYLDDHLWNALHTRARSRKTSVSELVREAVRERYLGKRDEQMKAMQEFVGIRKERSEPADAVEYIQALRRGDRLERLHKT
jgi:Ribbon-helix-helix protein, copG family